MIARLGKEIDNPDSVYYWAYKVRVHLCTIGRIRSEFICELLGIQGQSPSVYA